MIEGALAVIITVFVEAGGGGGITLNAIALDSPGAGGKLSWVEGKIFDFWVEEQPAIRIAPKTPAVILILWIT